MEYWLVNWMLEYVIAFILCVMTILFCFLLMATWYGLAVAFRHHVQSLSSDNWRSRCLEHVVEKITHTNMLMDRQIAAEDLVAKSIYNYDVVKKLGKDLSEIFGKQYHELTAQYPELTSLDLLVLTLLGIDMNNAEICSVLRMERRTLYRRRQLIAQRIGISSTELEQFAVQVFSNE